MNSRCCITLTKSFRQCSRGPACRGFHLVIVGFLMLGIFNAVGPDLALAQNSQATQKATTLENKTQRLAALLARYQQADENEQAQLEDDLISLAADRKQVLLSLIEDSPGKVLQQALPVQLLKDVPDKVRGHLEQQVELEGVLELVDEDYEDSNRLRYFLKAKKERFSLNFSAQPLKLKTGAHVRVNGVYIEGAMALESENTSVTILQADGPDAITSQVILGASGDQRTLVLLVNFQDDPTNKPLSFEEVYDLVFGTVSDYFAENSSDQTWLSGDVSGWYTLPIDSTVCYPTGIENEAAVAAAADGIDLTTYDRIIHVFPKSGCTWAGMASVEASGSWINGVSSFTPRVVGHELGHNFGLLHAHAMNCGESVLGIDCIHLEYGDHLDIMGNRVAHLSPFNKEMLGWLGTTAITTADSNDIYRLSPYEETGAYDPKALKVLKSIDSTTGVRTWYYLESRQAIGLDSFLLQDHTYYDHENILNGVVVRIGTEGDRNSGYLLDMTPGSKFTSDYSDLDDPALMVGESYTDPDTGLTLRLLSADATGVDVEVIFSHSPSCVPAAPSLILSPLEGEPVEAGTTVTYSATITNNDSLECPAASFELGVTIPGDWTALFDMSSISLEPGGSSSTAFEVSSSPTVLEGLYSLPVSVQNSLKAEYSTNGMVSYLVVETDSVNEPPIATNDSATTIKDIPVIINVLANDADPENDVLTVNSISQGSEGTVVINSDSTVTYTPSSDAKNRDTFSYTVTDGLNTATAKVAVKLQRAPK